MKKKRRGVIKNGRESIRVPGSIKGLWLKEGKGVATWSLKIVMGFRSYLGGIYSQTTELALNEGVAESQ
jgi:hypothetical protein